MGSTTKWRVIGLWRIWDDLPDAPAPTERPPEALMERIAGVFDHAPTKAEAEEAVIAAGTAMRDAFEAREIVAHLVIAGDATWARAGNEGGWLPEGVRRHPPGGRYLHALLGYGLKPSAGERVWMHAETDRKPAEDVVARLRHLGDEMGLPPADLDSGLPIFEGRETRTPHRRRQAERHRDGGAL